MHPYTTQLHPGLTCRRPVDLVNYQAVRFALPNHTLHLYSGLDFVVECRGAAIVTGIYLHCSVACMSAFACGQGCWRKTGVIGYVFVIMVANQYSIGLVLKHSSKNIDTQHNGTVKYLARTCASVVFPVPGGPESKII
jgi:hypothetical protein